MTFDLRQWEITDNSPYELHLAADARLCQTSYTNDQSWDVLIGRGEDAGFKLQTHYGFRVGLASLVPMWSHDNRVIYQAQTYHEAPTITSFAPNIIIIEADILPNIQLVAEHIAMSSQIIGGYYTLTNNTERTVNLRFELFGHVGADGDSQKLAIITMAQGGHALSMGKFEDLSPVVFIEDGDASSISGRRASPKVGIDITVEAGKSQVIRWVHAGLDELRSSLAEARRWLVADWEPFRESIQLASEAIPTIQTGNLDWDLVIASSYNRVMQSALRPAGILPRQTFVQGRLPELGYNKYASKSQPRMWDGQNIDTAYLIVPILATIDPHFAEGIVRNYIALQKKNGFIDFIPDAMGAHSEILCTPILARLAWAVYQQTGNLEFIEQNFQGLQLFLEWWLKQDIDFDGVPEWQDQRQLHYLAFPTFGMGRDWAQGADISTAETPDLLAYLISEATALASMANELDRTSDKKQLHAIKEDLLSHLADFWDGDYYTYRDRDTDITTSGAVLLDNGRGDEQHVLEQALLAPNRVIIKVIGGARHTPKIQLHITGTNSDSEAVVETAEMDDFYWYKGEGVYTSQTTFSQVNTIHCEGLSRVYRIRAYTMDTTGIDLNAMMPLIADIPKQQAQAIATLALSKKAYMRPNGITMTHINESTFDSTSAEGAGGVWMYFQTLLGESLLKNGYGDAVTEMVKSQLNMLVDVLVQNHEFAQFYDSDDAIALGAKGHLNGLAPLYLLYQLIGVQIQAHDTVTLRKDFAWGRGVTVRQHGVYVRRTNKRIKVEFASGHVVEMDVPLKDDVTLTDPDPVDTTQYNLIELPRPAQEAIPQPTPPEVEKPVKRVKIEVDIE